MKKINRCIAIVIIMASALPFFVQAVDFEIPIPDFSGLTTKSDIEVQIKEAQDYLNSLLANASFVTAKGDIDVQIKEARDYLNSLLAKAKGAASPNLIKNPSFETSDRSGLPRYWFKSNWGQNQANFTYPVSGYNSPKAAKVQITQYSDGDAKWYFQDVAVTSGKQYLFADYYLSNIPSTITVRFLLKDKTYLYLDIGQAGPSADWQKFEQTISVPNNVVSLTVFHLIKEVGWLTIDNFSLTGLTLSDKTPPVVAITSPLPNETLSGVATLIAQATDNVGVASVQFIIDGNNFAAPDTAPPYSIAVDTNLFADGPHTMAARAVDFSGNSATSNGVPVLVSNAVQPPEPPSSNLIENPSLEITDSSGLPQFWFQGNWGQNQASFTYPVSGYDSPKAAQVQITQYSDGDAKWYFQDVAVTPGKQYVFADYYLANIDSAIVVRFHLADESYQYFELGQAGPSADWQKFEQTISVPNNVVSLTVFHLIKEVGWLTVDNFSLEETTGGTGFLEGFVSLNFDDGWLVTYQNALPILNQAGLKSTQNIITGSFQDPQYVNQAQVLDMQAAGHEIGSHTKTHSNLTQLSESQIQDEVAGSRQDLLAAGVSSVKTFVYPYGQYNSTVQAIVKDSGYIGARTADTGFNTKDTNHYGLRIQSVEVDTAFSQVKNWIDSAVGEKTWLILVFHQIDHSGLPYSSTPETLQQIVNYLKQQNISVLTNEQGIQLMSQ